jgi:predicted enzyme related to lactoylglutathione lyase
MLQGRQSSVRVMDLAAIWTYAREISGGWIYVMARVLGLGGLFFKSADPAATRQWYADVLGLEADEWGTFFTPAAAAANPGAGTASSPFAANTEYFAPSDKEFMFNLMVDDLDGILAQAAGHGVQPVKLMPDEGMGPFAHIMDPEGRKIELWQPKPMG